MPGKGGGTAGWAGIAGACCPLQCCASMKTVPSFARSVESYSQAGRVGGYLGLPGEGCKLVLPGSAFGVQPHPLSPPPFGLSNLRACCWIFLFNCTPSLTEDQLYLAGSTEIIQASRL